MLFPIGPRVNYNATVRFRALMGYYKKSAEEMERRNRTDHQAFITGELYLFHSTDRSCPAMGGLYGIFDKITNGILYLESSSSDLIHFRLWHRLPSDYRYCRHASRTELRDYIFNLTLCERLEMQHARVSRHTQCHL